jgi:hypothetical protein
MATRRSRRVRRRIAGAALSLLGLLVWAGASGLHLASLDPGLVRLDHFTQLFIGVVAGGALLVAGIMLLTTSY